MKNILTSDTATIIYSYTFVIGGISTAIWYLFRHGVQRIIATNMEELRLELAAIAELDKKMDRIEYALYNDGKTGLVNKVDSLIENQQRIKEDVLVLKTKASTKRRSSS